MCNRDGRIIERQRLEYPAEFFETDGRILKPEYSYLDTVESSQITYWSDGLRITGFLIKPKVAGDHPCVIFNRGGNRDFGAVDLNRLANVLCRIASWGYVVVASQYRGHGPNEGQDEFGGKDIHDVMNLIPLLESETEADASRIGMYGGSRGGMMTYLTLARTDRIRAAVVRCGISDLTDAQQNREDMCQVFRELIPGYSLADDKPLVVRSAVYWADKLCKHTPILLLHGTADWRVNPLSALHFAEALLKANHPFRLVMLEGSDHFLTEHTLEQDHQTREWLDRFVRDRGPLPNLEPHGD